MKELTAFRSGNSLWIRFPLRGKDAYARAQWAGSAESLPPYEYRLAILTLERAERSADQPAARRGTRIPMRDARQWQQLVQSILEGLAPREPNRGVILLVQNQEVVVFRDKDSRLDVERLETKPREIEIERTYNDADFSRKAIELLEASLSAIDRAESQFLFVTGQDPAFVLFDTRQRLTVFLSYPMEPDTGAGGAPALFVVRALNSLLVKSMVLCAIKNPFTVVGRGLWHIGRSGATVLQSGLESPTEPLPPLNSGDGMDLAAWEKELDKIVSSRRYKGRLELLIDGERFFPALIQSIQNAERGIDMLVYIFDNDDYAVKVADLLKERSATVRVRVLMDEMGSLFGAENLPATPMPPDFVPPADIKSYLKSGSRVHVRKATNPWLTADHRKCIVFDGRQAYIGGMNIGREYRYEWHDLMVGLTGPIAARLGRDFDKAWAHAGPLGDFAYAWVALFESALRPRHEPPEGIDIRPLYTQTARLEIYHAQIAAIRRAKRYIYIENPYFVDDTIVRELVRARRRGVDVRVILPAENDLGVMNTSNLVTANNMVRNGIRVYAYPGMTHVKAAIFDGWACVGSANLNKMSLFICHELNVGFSDPATVQRLDIELFEADFAKSRELTGPLGVSWLDSVVETFADQF